MYKIHAIIFDCFGVLTADAWKEFVGTLPSDQREKASSINRAYDSGLVSKEEFGSQVLELTGKQPRYDELFSGTVMPKNHQLLGYIEELKKSYKIGILSNVASDWIVSSFLDTNEQKLFDAMVFSYQIGASKPEARMYETAAEKLAVSMAECVFIDDSERYCIAARDLGMKAICYQDFDQVKLELEEILNNSKS